MPTYKDFALLNSSLDQLGEGLLRRKMLELQDADRKEQRGLQRERNAIDQQRWESQEAYNQRMEKKVDLHNAFQQMESAGKNLRRGMVDFSEQVRGAGMDNQAATDQFKSAIDSLSPEMKEGMLKDPTIKAAYDGEMDWATFGTTPSKDVMPKEYSVGGRKGLVSANGQVIPDSDPDKRDNEMELRLINDQIRDNEKEINKLAAPRKFATDTERLEAGAAVGLLRQRINDLEKKKAALKSRGEPAEGAAGGDDDDELTRAKNAISKGADPAKIKALYKQRTGKVFPE